MNGFNPKLRAVVMMCNMAADIKITGKILRIKVRKLTI